MAVKHVGLNLEALKTRSVLSTTSESKTIQGSEVSVQGELKLQSHSYGEPQEKREEAKIWGELWSETPFPSHLGKITLQFSFHR